MLGNAMVHIFVLCKIVLCGVQCQVSIANDRDRELAWAQVDEQLEGDRYDWALAPVARLALCHII